jgi:hypothetical protein
MWDYRQSHPHKAGGYGGDGVRLAVRAPKLGLKADLVQKVASKFRNSLCPDELLLLVAAAGGCCWWLLVPAASSAGSWLADWRLLALSAVFCNCHGVSM